MKVIDFIEEYFNSGESLTFVTGNSERMQRIIIAVIDEYRLEHTVGDPFDSSNKGYIKVQTSTA